MFVPTIKYKKVNADKNEPTLVAKAINSREPVKKQQHQQGQSHTTVSSTISKGNNTTSETSNELVAAAPIISQLDRNVIMATTDDVTFEEKNDATVTVDPGDDERILITLSDGKTQYTADRYCPHAGADLSYLGRVDEDEYPPEVGPILLCTLHYWEFALKRAGRGANGVATINACPFVGGTGGEFGDTTCHAKSKLDW